MSETILKLDQITKVYGNGVVANQDISVDFIHGEIHSIVGENGAGKSTLMKILFGIEHASSGTITYKGQQVRFSNSMEAIKNGIGMVHQHFMLIPSFTVAENIVLGSEPKKSIFLDKKKAVAETAALAEKYHFDINVQKKVADLSVGAKQKVEILKALYRNAQVIILDEPTAVLTPQETEALFEELLKFKKMGHTILFISHHLNEVKQISDRITIMRGGKSCGTYNNADITLEEMTSLIVGRDIISDYNAAKQDVLKEKAVLSLEHVSLRGANKMILNDIHFQVRSGEILGIAGVQGNGQSELIKTIAGMHKLQQGAIKLCEEDVSHDTIKQKRQKGLSYIPEDRMEDGIAMGASVNDNLISTFYDRKDLNHRYSMNKKAMTNLANRLIQTFSIKTQSPKTNIESLSGGNIQKVVVAREYETNPILMIAEQPTRGIDIGSADFIHHQLLSLRNAGSGILLCSADLNEVMDLSDRIIVMYEGEIVAYFKDVKSISEKELGLYMLGVKKQSASEIAGAYHD